MWAPGDFKLALKGQISVTKFPVSRFILLVNVFVIDKKQPVELMYSTCVRFKHLGYMYLH